jgi:osmoprotectant transport system ATP-binding protein
MTDAIAFRDVSKAFPGGHRAVEHLDLKIADGEFCVLLGASGCGKTTTLRMINRLIEPTTGEVYVHGQNVKTYEPFSLRRGIGYVIQAVGLFPHMTVAQNVAVVPNLLGWSKREIGAKVDELLETVHLDPKRFRNRLPQGLSGGERQRVGFARALAASPRIMLLDEPFGALDPITRDALQAELKELQETLGFTAVMVTHDMAEALRLADKIVVLDKGKVLQVGSPRELAKQPADKVVSDLVAAPLEQARAILAEID